MSESKTIYSELSRIQRAIKAPKSQYNKFGKYNYRNCEDILEGFKKVQEDCCLVINDNVTRVDQFTYIEATATLFYKDQSISSKAYAREPLTQAGMSDSQITGSASSYARKYALNALFAIDDTKDDDSRDNTAQKPDQSNTKTNGPSDKQKKMLNDLLKTNNIPLTDSLKSKLQAMSGKQMSNLISHLMKEKVLPDELC